MFRGPFRAARHVAGEDIRQPVNCVRSGPHPCLGLVLLMCTYSVPPESSVLELSWGLQKSGCTEHGFEVLSCYAISPFFLSNLELGAVPPRGVAVPPTASA